MTDGGTVWLDPLTTNSWQSNDPRLVPLDQVRQGRSGLELDSLQLTKRNANFDETDDILTTQLDAWKHRVEVGREMGIFGYLEGKILNNRINIQFHLNIKIFTNHFQFFISLLVCYLLLFNNFLFPNFYNR